MNDESKSHTPFCQKDCAIVHHDLIKALCIERNRKETSSRFSSKSHVLLRQCVQLYEQNGWDRNSPVPDNLPDLRHPLLYLTCAFGKHRVLETLVKLDFDPSVVTKDGENGLHALVDHFYRVGNMKQCGGFMAIDKRLEVFENVVSTLCARDPHIFSVQEKRNGRTPLHIAATSVVCTSRHARVDGRCDPLKRTRYFQRCLEVMLGHLIEFKNHSLLTHAQLIKTIAAQDNWGNTILHILAKSSSLPGWESIQNILKNFADSELPLVKNNDSKTAFEILSSIDTAVARKLFYPRELDGKEKGKPRDAFACSSSPLNCEQPQKTEAAVSAIITCTPNLSSNGRDPDIAVKAVWSQAGQVEASPSKVTQQGSSLKSLESVVLSLRTTVQGTTSQHPSTGTPASSHYDGSPTDVVVFDRQSRDSTTLETSECRGDSSSSCMDCESLPVSSNGNPAHSGSEDFASQGLSNDEPYPVFLPNFPASRLETVDCTHSSAHEITKQEIDLTFSQCHVSPLSQNNAEVENHAASPSTPDSWTLGHEARESIATPVTSNGLSHLDFTTKTVEEKNHSIANSVSSEKDATVPENSKASSSTGDSAFFDFLLTQGSEFNPSMKFQIVELIKSEFGKKMASFDTEICQTETEKRRLEAEIRNSQLRLKQKEEEKLRLFAEIDNLQKGIVRATEKHKMLAQQCVKLKEESNAVKRKISSCEEVEKELFGSPAKTNKLSER